MKIVGWIFALIFPIVALAQDQSAIPKPVQVAPAPVIYESGVARFQDQLKLTAAQMASWQPFVDKINAYSRLIYGEIPVTAFAAESGVRQVGHMVDTLQNRLAAMEEIEDAAKLLYAALDPEQKKLADQFMVGAIPLLASATCPTPTDKKSKTDKSDAPQRGHHGGGGMGGM